MRRPWLDPASTGAKRRRTSHAEALRVGDAGKAGRRPSLLIHGTTTTSRYTGSQAAAILGRLGVVAPAYDVKAGCSTSLAALHMAVAFLRCRLSRTWRSACAETLSRVMHPDVRETWFGLADGGAALWMDRDEAAPEFAITQSVLLHRRPARRPLHDAGPLPPTPGDVRANGVLPAGRQGPARASWPESATPRCSTSCSRPRPAAPASTGSSRTR